MNHPRANPAHGSGVVSGFIGGSMTKIERVSVEHVSISMPATGLGIGQIRAFFKDFRVQFLRRRPITRICFV
jgi:hypothetical protein